MKTYLFFDTETSGLHCDCKTNTPFPRMLTFAGVLASEDGETIETYYDVVKVRFKIPPFATKINKITNEYCKERGKPLKEVMLKIKELIERADVLVAHNYEFDLDVLKGEFGKINADKDIFTTLETIKYHDTMMESTDFCKLPPHPGYTGYKFPRLAELHRILFGCDFEGAHNALSDTLACKKCFFELKRLGIITD